jgi:hypothetical protein
LQSQESPRTKPWVSLKLKTTIQMQDGIMLKEHNKGRNLNFIFNLRLFEFPYLLCFVRQRVYLKMYLCYGIVKKDLKLLKGLPRTFLMKHLRIYLGYGIPNDYLGSYLGPTSGIQQNT